jgi:hypothetical protein
LAALSGVFPVQGLVGQMRGSGTGPAVVEEWWEIAPHGSGAWRRFETLLAQSPAIAKVRGLLGVRGGIWLVNRRGVLTEVSEPPSLLVRPFENAQVAGHG